MITVNTIDFTSIEDIKSNPDMYREIYLRDKIIVFRNAHLNKDEQTNLMQFFGDLFGWYPNSTDTNPSDYVETHHRNMGRGVEIGKDELILNWHIEHVQNQDDPHMGATWRMEKFLCNEDSGHTFFVDMSNLFEQLTEDDQDFFSRCLTKVDTEIIFDGKNTKISNEFESVNIHPLTGEKTIRIALFDSEGKLNNLSKVDNREPTQEELQRYRSLVVWICDQVWNNEDIRMVLKWKEGDLAVPDLYKLAHSVSGGFTRDQRVLSGQFGRLQPWLPRKNK
jgi:alpha-ketoglutarate-dependent taurine dioxygenase